MTAHPLDTALAAASPLVPNLYAGLPEVPEGQKQIVGAADGLYVRAATPALSVCARIADAKLPYAPLVQSIRPKYGPIPLTLLHDFVEWAQISRNREIAAVIETYGPGYCLRRLEPTSASGAHITYDDTQVEDDALVVDLHSHGKMPAFFSSTDDESDLSRRGPYIAAVVGECGTRDIVSFRLVAPPYLIPLDIDWLVENGVFA